MAAEAATRAAAITTLQAKLPAAAVIGGVQVGAAGAAGTMYAGYILAGGDDFGESKPNLASWQNPRGKYFYRRAYTEPQTPNDSPFGSIGLVGVDCAPGDTGYNDINRGIPVPTIDTIQQANSIITLKERQVTAGAVEALIGDQSQQHLSGMINSAGAMVATWPCIIECFVASTGATVSGSSALVSMHPSFWLKSMFPASTYNSIEKDFETFDGTGYNFTGYDEPGTSTHTQYATGTDALAPGTIDGNFHKLTFVLGTNAAGTSGQVQYYIDDNLVYTATISTLSKYGLKPDYFLISAHSTVQHVLATPLTMQVDWVRIWVPNNIWKAQAQQADLLAPFNTAFSFTLPSAATVWGSAIGSNTDMLEAICNDVAAPGGNANGMWGGALFPDGITYTGGVLAGTVSDQPGRLYMSRYYTGAGDYCEPQRFSLCIGPRILSPATRAAVIGTAYSHDVYADCDVGNLLPKTITVTGLPAGLTYLNAGTGRGIISGTPTALGTYTITCTNGAGQSVSQTVTLAAPTAGSGAATPPVTSGLLGAIDFDNSGNLTLSGSNVTAAAGAFGTTYGAVQTTAANGPTVAKTGYRNAAVFNGSSQYMDWTPLLTGAGGAAFEDLITMVVIGEAVAGATGNLLDVGISAHSIPYGHATLAMSPSGYTGLVFEYGSLAAWHAAGDGAAFTGAPFMAVGRKPSVVQGVGSGTVTTISSGSSKPLFRKDGGAVYSDSTNAGTGAIGSQGTLPDKITIGAGDNAGTIGGFADCSIFAVLFYSRDLLEWEVNQLRSWASANYGTP